MKKLLLLTTLFLMALSGCMKSSDFEDLKLNINTSMPLGSMSFDDQSLMELASVDNLKYDQNDVAYIGDNISLDVIQQSDLKKIFSISTQTIKLKKDLSDKIEGIVLPDTPIPLPEGLDTEYKLELEDGVVVKDITLANGVVSLQSNDDAAYYEGMVCTIDEITRNGVPIKFKIGENKNIAGYKITPNDNKITVKISGTVVNTTTVDCQIVIDQMEVKSALGFFGNKEINKIKTELKIDDSTKDFFNYIEDFYIANPQITLNVESDINVPTLVIISQISIDGTKLNLKTGLDSDRFLIDSKKEYIKISNANFVNNNELSNAITSSLSSVLIELTTILNPTNEQIGSDIVISKINSFNSDSKITGELDVAIPINGYFKNITFNDKFDMNLGDDIKEYEYRNISYAITSKNTFPLDIILKLYTENSNGELMPLGDDFTTIPSALNNVNPKNGSVTPGIINDSNAKIITLNERDSKRFMSAEKIVFEIKASSTNVNQKEIINFYKGLALNFNMILGVDGTINFK